MEKNSQHDHGGVNDPVGSHSEYYLHFLQSQKDSEGRLFSDIQTVLVVLSAAGMIFDLEGLRQKIIHAYPGAAVFFKSTSGDDMGTPAPQKVDLLIDLTGPRQRQGWFYAKKLRKQAKYAVGRNVGLFRKKIYDRIYDEKAQIGLTRDILKREEIVQKEVLSLAGISFAPVSSATPDRSKEIARNLPKTGYLPR